MIKKAEEKRNRYLRTRQVWEGGPVTCLCCNLPSRLISEGAVLRAIPEVSKLALSRDEIAALVEPILRAETKDGVKCPRCYGRMRDLTRRRPTETKPKNVEQKLYYVQLDDELRLGPMCVHCVTEVVADTNTERTLHDIPVWIVKCGAAALEMMKKIDFRKVRRVSVAKVERTEELLY